LSSASGAPESSGVGSALMGPSSGRGGREAKNWWPYKEFDKTECQQHTIQRDNKKVKKFRLQVAYLWQGVRGVEERIYTSRNLHLGSKSSQWSHPLVEILFL
jgi:hypothetical protein